MLVLSRRLNESVVLPDLGISIKVIRFSGNQVRLGFSAPSDVKILRGELADNERQWQEENQTVPLHPMLNAS
jgi:carbon storage regulator